MAYEFDTPADAMTLAYEISDDHFAETRRLVGYGSFDHDNAELVLRCPAVFTDRMTPEEFKQLDPGLQNGFRYLAGMVSDQLGIDPNDLEPHRNETPVQHAYRTNVSMIIHGLQRMVSIGPRPESGGYDPEKESFIREEVFLASDLFRRALPQAVEKGFPGVIETLGYFRSTTRSQR